MTNQEQALRSVLMKYTEKHQYRRCLVNDQCTTGEMVIGGHQISKNHMQRLPGQNSMRVFTKHRFGRPEPKLPMKEGINNATVGYFICKLHDALFQEVDQLEDIRSLPQKRVLDLMCYRNILYNRWWMHLWAQASERMKHEHGLENQYEIARILRTDDHIMLASQKAIESSLGLGKGPDLPFQHLALRSHGMPTLAAAVFGVLKVQTDRTGRETASHLDQWGLTLVPGSQSTTLFLHFPADSGTQVIEMALPSLAKGYSKVSGREITKTIFSSCYDVVFSADSWNSLPDQARSEIIHVMRNNDQKDALTVDVFRGSDWEIV